MCQFARLACTVTAEDETDFGALIANCDEHVGNLLKSVRQKIQRHGYRPWMYT